MVWARVVFMEMLENVVECAVLFVRLDTNTLLSVR
jgi:hypothetical protein